MCQFDDIPHLLQSVCFNSTQLAHLSLVQAVVPLNEECGLLEWVPNTVGLRNILCKLYQWVE